MRRRPPARTQQQEIKTTYASPASPLHLPCISPTSPLHLRCISPAGPEEKEIKFTKGCILVIKDLSEGQVRLRGRGWVRGLG